MSQLLMLPAELRTSIFEFVYPPQHQQSGTVDLLSSDPPSKSLLLTNKQLYSEARGIHRTSYRSFWSSTHFTLNVDFEDEDDDDGNTITSTRAALVALRKVDMDHIRNLTIHLAPTSKFMLVHPYGAWKLEVGSRTTYRRYRPWTIRGELVPTRLAYDGHAEAESLIDACNHYSRRGTPVINQVLDLLDLELVNYAYGRGGGPEV